MHLMLMVLIGNVELCTFGMSEGGYPDFHSEAIVGIIHNKTYFIGFICLLLFLISFFLFFIFFYGVGMWGL